MKRQDVADMVYAIIQEADYDLAKQLNEETAEEPEFAEEFMGSLIYVAGQWVEIEE